MFWGVVDIMNSLNDLNLDNYNLSLEVDRNSYNGDLIIRLKKKIEVIEKERKQYLDSMTIDNNYFNFVGSVVETVYKKPNGEIIYKETKNRPVNSHKTNSYGSDFYLNPGMYNNYGHLVLNCYEQYCFNFKNL